MFFAPRALPSLEERHADRRIGRAAEGHAPGARSCELVTDERRNRSNRQDAESARIENVDLELGLRLASYRVRAVFLTTTP
jgi:hypothetical protein